MRPRKTILLWSESEDQASELAFVLPISLHVTVDRVSTACEYKAALSTHSYDLVMLIDPNHKRRALMHMAGPATAVLVTTGKRTKSNAVLLHTAKVLLDRKRGPVPAIRPVRVYAEVA
jgi:hypothetical protein